MKVRIEEPMVIHNMGTPKERRAKSAFIPPCTKQTFMKYYSPTSGSMVAWTRTDAEAYLKNIYRTLSQKFKVKEYVPNSI